MNPRATGRPPSRSHPRGAQPGSPFSRCSCPLFPAAFFTRYSRLGLPERKRLALFSNLIAAIAPASFPFLFDGALEGSRPISTLLLAAYFYKTQEGLFQRHVSAGGRRGSLLVPGILAILAMAALAIAAALL